MKARRLARPRQCGALLLEALVAIVLCAFALLGFAGLQSRASAAEFEAFQRSQALLLVQDMTSRLNTNRALADDYVMAGLLGGGDLEVCGGATIAERDLCEWSNLLRGASEVRGGNNIGAMLSARGCVTRAAGTSNAYVVTVVWQGLVPTGGADAPCGQGAAIFPDDRLRRASSTAVCIARLRDIVPPPLVDRC